MPIPTPNSDESPDEFMERCMADSTMVSEYPDDDQRAAVCSTQLESIGEDDMSDEKQLMPDEGETQDEFMARCMVDDVMNEEFPDVTERAVACSVVWDESEPESEPEEDVEE